MVQKQFSMLNSFTGELFQADDNKLTELTLSRLNYGDKK